MTKRSFFAILLAGTALPFSFSAIASGPFLPLTAVASYPNSPQANETIGARVVTILKENQIECTELGSVSMTVYVQPESVGKALQVLAKAIIGEKLPLTLLVAEGSKLVVASPESILELKTEK